MNRLRQLGQWLAGLPGRFVHYKHRTRLVIGAVVALLTYPVLGTLALWTGFVERVALSEDLRLAIDNPSYTIWPGRVHLKHVTGSIVTSRSFRSLWRSSQRPSHRAPVPWGTRLA